MVMEERPTADAPGGRRAFWRILPRLQGEGLTILLTTPYLDEAERCQTVALMDHGRLLTVSSPEELRASGQGAHQVMVEIIATPKPRTQAPPDARRDVAAVDAFGERLHVTP